ncbi:MAG: PD-(D/E)XK nuclease family protein [Cyanophyceae cyanobacterium]
MQPLFRLSQGQLNLLEKCPPLFQQVYLEQLRSPTNPQQQDKLAWGKQFHLLMQQWELGLPIEALLHEDEQLEHSFTALVQAAPEIWQLPSGAWREAEHCRTLSFQGYLLTTIYDLLIAGPSQAQIIDWKTHLQPQNRAKLAQDWQTRLYLYVLAETSDYLPEQISMTYWFVKLPTQPQRLTFTYSSGQHEATRQDLATLVAQLEQYLKNHLQVGLPFPHTADCENCPYREALLISEATMSQKTTDSWQIADIEEVSL